MSDDVVDVAARRPATSSTAKNAERAAANVVDGDPRTRWTSLYEDNQWLTVDLGQVYKLSHVTVRWEVAHASRYRIEGSLDSTKWKVLAEEKGQEGWVSTQMPSGSEARWVRMFGETRATNFGFSIYDFRVFAHRAAAPAAPRAAAPPAPTPKAPAGRPMSAAAPSMDAWQSAGEDGRFEVVHERVVMRSAPSVKASMIGAAKIGDTYYGSPYSVDGSPWLRIDRAVLEESGVKLPKGVEAQCGWLLMDGKAVGLGQLLKKIADDGSRGVTRAPAPKAKAATAPKEEEEREVHASPYAAAGDFLVVHEKVVERSQPSTSAKIIATHKQGEVIWGVPCFVAETATPWLRVDSANGKLGWMLIDGVSVGLGQLLQPARDITEDLQRWARQQKKTKAGQQVEWTDSTEDELARIETVARAQVEGLRSIADNQKVLQELTSSGFVKDQEDYSLGSEGITRQVLRVLLRRRAGIVVLREEPKSDKLPWSEEEFPRYLAKKVMPLAPFRCRTLRPEDQEPQRLLIFLHGSLVRGDDLVGEAEVLRKMMPDAIVVLPEAPVVASAEHELRVWWTAPEQKSNASDIVEARKLGLLTAPKDAIDRAVLTVHWAAMKFKGLPIILGGFSQGSMLIAQALTALNTKELDLRGLILLSGLAVPFEAGKTKVLAIHGDADERIKLDVAKEVSEHQSLVKADLRLEVFKGMGHAISDEVLDRIVTFCNEVAPVERALVAYREESKLNQDANQAKLLRWVKTVSKATSMFDDPRFMSHITEPNMKGVGDNCPTLGNGLFHYYLRDVQQDRKAVAIIFHGRSYDLRAETYHLSEAYKKLNISTAIIDYRQKFSAFNIDATVVLEELESITGDTTTPIILHGIGCGGIHALHIGVASQAYPATLRRRLRLMVLDGAVSNFKALPPSPTGCIATDPIGNDEKLKYIGMPLLVVGGDDPCCGNKWRHGAGHWTSLSKSAQNFLEDGLLTSVHMNPGTILMPDSGSRFNGDAFLAITDALDNPQGAKGKATERFLKDILANTNSDEERIFARKFKADEMKELCNEILKEAKKEETVLQLWENRRAPENTARDEHMKIVVNAHFPALIKNGKFTKGLQGYREFNSNCNILGEMDEDLRKLHAQVQAALDPATLDKVVETMQEDKEACLGVRWAQVHEMLEWALGRWESDETYNEMCSKLDKLGNSAQVRKGIRELGLEMNLKAAQRVGIEGSDGEAGMLLARACSHYAAHDPTLNRKTRAVQEASGKLTKRLLEFTNSMKEKKAVEDSYNPKLKALEERMRQKLAGGNASTAGSTGALAMAPTSSAPTDAPGAALQAAPSAPVSAPPEPTVQVKAEHAMEGGPGLTVTVPSSATLLDVRKAIVARLGDDADLDEVRIVARIGESGFRVLSDEKPLGDQRTVVTTGRSLQVEAAVGSTETAFAFARGDKLIVLQNIVTDGAPPVFITMFSCGTVSSIDENGATIDFESVGEHRVRSADFSKMVKEDEEVAGLGLEADSGVADEGLEVFQAPDVTLIVHIDRSLGLSSEMTFPSGTKARAIKDQLAEADPTGETKPDDFGLRLPGSDALLGDDALLTAAITEVDVCMAEF